MVKRQSLILSIARGGQLASRACRTEIVTASHSRPCHCQCWPSFAASIFLVNLSPNFTLGRPGLCALLLAMLPTTLWSLSLILVFSSLVRAQGPVRTIFPAAFPLAVKTPYLSTWYEAYVGSSALSNCWPQFWTLAVSIPFNAESDLAYNGGRRGLHRLWGGQAKSG